MEAKDTYARAGEERPEFIDFMGPVTEQYLLELRPDGRSNAEVFDEVLGAGEWRFDTVDFEEDNAQEMTEARANAARATRDLTARMTGAVSLRSMSSGPVQNRTAKPPMGRIMVTEAAYKRYLKGKNI